MNKISSKALILACATSLTLCGSCAPKQKALHSADDFFATYDADASGDVTREEFVSKWKDKEKAHKNFTLMDLEGKGHIQRNAAQDLEQNASLWNQVDMDDSTAQEP
jgi:Ca2+-binding EF-hand superfamily protein